MTLPLSRRAMLAFIMVLDWAVRAAIHIVFFILSTCLVGLEVVLQAVHVLVQSLDVGVSCHVL